MANQQKYPWEDWDEKKRAQADKAVALADSIKAYKSAGGIGVAAEARGAAIALQNRGGLSPEEATNLARYKQFKNTTGGDPNWQGPMQINAGPREDPQDTEAETQARNARFHSSSKEEKVKLWAQQENKVERLKENFYDSLVIPPKDRTTVSVRDALSESMDDDEIKKRRRGG